MLRNPAYRPSLKSGSDTQSNPSPAEVGRIATTAAEPPPAGARRRGTTGSPDLLNGPISPTLWRLAMPLVLGFVINAVYSWTDTYFVSRLGDAAIAAVGFSDQINFVLFTLGSGFAIGTGIVVARRIGEGRRWAASLIATRAYSFMAVYATVAAGLLYLVLPHVFRLLGLSGQTLAMTNAYMLTLLIGFPANLLMFQANASVRSTGDTVFPMAVLIISAVSNLAVDPVLIFGLLGFPALGITGAAISTSIAQWLGAAISSYALYTGRLNLKLYRPTLRFDWDTIGQIFRIGVPSSLQTLAVSSSRVLMLTIANLFGTAAVAAYSIGIKVDILVFMPIFATSIAIETLVSQNIGAGQFHRVKKFRAVAIRQLGVVTIAMGSLIYVFATQIAHIFTTNADAVAYTVGYMHVVVFGYVFFVIGGTGMRSLSGAGHATRSMLIVVAVLLVCQVPLAWVLSRGTSLGISGLYFAVVISYVIYAIVGSLAVRGDRWMIKRV